MDVLVTYCGEGLDIITDTFIACCKLDYPQARYRVIVLDDSRSIELADIITRLKRSYPNLYHASRNTRVETHSKAANLNFGLRYTENLSETKSDYLAVLDVDMIPVPHWLRAVLPHVHESSHIGLASCTQSFYNLPTDPLLISPNIRFMKSLAILQDYSNSAFCNGSGFVIRRCALESIGGVPESSIQEDLVTSLQLGAKGWETIFLGHEHLQWGLVPDTFAGWVNQRQRWTAGAISVSQYLCSKEAEGLPGNVRIIGGLWGATEILTASAWTLAFLTLPVLVVMQQPLVEWTGTIRFKICFGLAVVDFAAQSSTQILLSSLQDFQLPILNQLSTAWTSPYRLTVALRCYVIPKLSGLGLGMPKFKPSNSPSHGARERDARRSGSRITHSKIILLDCGGFLHLGVLAVCLTGGVIATQTVLLGLKRDQMRLVLRIFLTAVGWPPIFTLWAALMNNALVPVLYAFCPPVLLTRGDFLSRDKDSGVVYPTPKAKDDYFRRGRQDLLYFVCLYYLLMMALVYTLG